MFTVGILKHSIEFCTLALKNVTYLKFVFFKEVKSNNLLCVLNYSCK